MRRAFRQLSEKQGGEEKNIYSHQNDTPEPSLQTRQQIDRCGEYNQPFYRFKDRSVVIPVPIGDRAFKEKVGEWKEVTMSIIVVRHKVKSAVDQHTPSKNR